MHSRLIVLTLLIASPALHAADQPRWQIRAGYAHIDGLRLGFAAPVGAAPSTASLTDRYYDDGFNRVDASNNLGDGPDGPLASRTGFFSFQRDSQVDLQNDTLTLSKLELSEAERARRHEVHGGSGLNVGLRMALQPTSRDWHWGWSVDFDWLPQSQSIQAYEGSVEARRLADRYQLGGVVPQQAPYTGHFMPQPGDQRIGDTPSRAISLETVQALSTRELKHELGVARVSAWLERHVGDAATIGIEAGPTWAIVQADISVDEVLFASDGLTATRSNSTSQNAILLGWQAGTRARCQLSSALGLEAAFAFARFEDDRQGPLTFSARNLRVYNVRLSYDF